MFLQLFIQIFNVYLHFVNKNVFLLKKNTDNKI